MTLSASEFLRRFTQHILPRGFVRIRQFGFLTNTRARARLALARQLLDAPEPSRAVGTESPPTPPPGDVLAAMARCGSAQISPLVNWLPSAGLSTVRRCLANLAAHITCPRARAQLCFCASRDSLLRSLPFSPARLFRRTPASSDAATAAFPASLRVHLPNGRRPKPQKHTSGSIARPAPPAASFKSPLSKVPRPGTLFRCARIFRPRHSR